MKPGKHVRITAPKFEWEPERSVEVFHGMRNSITVVWDAMPYILYVFYRYLQFTSTLQGIMTGWH